MAQSLAHVLLHVIFSTKHREPIIASELQAKLWAYMAGVVQQSQCNALRIGGVDDHVHILMTLGRTVTIASVLQELKTGSTHWMKAQGASTFAWQGGYGAFSVSESKTHDVIRYIEGQAEHHRTNTFQEEFREFLDRHGIAYDERYLWD